MSVISIAIQKGGSGKTTSAINLNATHSKKLSPPLGALLKKYNALDPDITLLEAHCYVITNVSYNTNLGIYKIDLSTVISKYIGETEKNLNMVLDAAQNQNWILLFEEADALFGKRTKVGNAHDKYANQEVAYIKDAIKNYKRKALFRFRDGSIMTPKVLYGFH